jgi:hypothetical protein|tara:strand:- start:5 stop:256 length:252 start_codon:yes stop_codon:yes gene_type:complete
MIQQNAHTRFNRHEIYTPEMLKMNIELSWGLISSQVRNLVAGLQDGYLYNDLLDVDFLKSEGIADSKIADIQMLTTLIQKNLN